MLPNVNSGRTEMSNGRAPGCGRQGSRDCEAVAPPDRKKRGPAEGVINDGPPRIGRGVPAEVSHRCGGNMCPCGQISDERVEW